MLCRGDNRGLERKYARLGAVRVEWELREVRGVYLKAPPKHNGGEGARPRRSSPS